MTNGNDPIGITHTNGYIGINPGLTKREYFAAMALQGMMSSGRVDVTGDGIAEFAVRQADALIKALNENQ